ncbi:hypothetical protein ACIGW3_32785, partial [Streptomyces sp. NPDC053499]
TRLRARYGRAWRRKAPVEALMPLKLTRYGVPLHRTAPRATTLPEPEPVPLTEPDALPDLTPAPVPSLDDASGHELAQRDTGPGTGEEPAHQHLPTSGPEAEPEPEPVPSPEPVPEPTAEAEPEPPATEFPVPVAPGRYRTLAVPTPPREQELFVEPAPLQQEPEPEPGPEPGYTEAPDLGDEPVGIPDGVPREEFYFSAYRQYVAAHGQFPTARQLSRDLYEGHGITTVDGSLLSETYLGGYMREFRDRYNTEMGLAG